MKLYELTGHYLALQERAEEGEDVSEQLAQIDDALEQKALGMLQVMRGLQGDIEALRAEEDRLERKRSSLEMNYARLKRYLKDAMVQGSIRSIKCGTFSISLRDGPPRVDVEDMSQLPPEYIREKTTREVDKAAILKAHNSTGEIPMGCNVVRDPALHIR